MIIQALPWPTMVAAAVKPLVPWQRGYHQRQIVQTGSKSVLQLRFVCLKACQRLTCTPAILSACRLYATCCVHQNLPRYPSCPKVTNSGVIGDAQLRGTCAYSTHMPASIQSECPQQKTSMILRHKRVLYGLTFWARIPLAILTDTALWPFHRRRMCFSRAMIFWLGCLQFLMMSWLKATERD